MKQAAGIAEDRVICFPKTTFRMILHAIVVARMEHMKRENSQASRTVAVTIDRGGSSV
jgi:hypothetical protein